MREIGAVARAYGSTVDRGDLLYRYTDALGKTDPMLVGSGYVTLECIVAERN